MATTPSQRHTIRRRALVAGAAWSVPVVAFGTATPAMAASTACDPTGTWDAQSQGRILSGGIAPLDLDTIVALEGGTADTSPDLTEDGVNGNPLSVEALSALTVNLTGTAEALSSLLDLNTGVGVLNQSAYASETGQAWGGSGVVDDTGAINIDDAGPAAPSLATLDLTSALEAANSRLGNSNSALVALLDTITNLKLTVGAAAGTASIAAGCEPALEREYLLAYLRTNVESDVVTALSSALRTWAGENTTIALDAGSLVNSVPLLSDLTNAEAELSVEIDTGAITGTLPDANGSALQLDLTNESGDGLLTVDLGQVLGYPDGGLNGLDPNTNLFADAPLPTPSVTAIVDEWLDALLSEIVTVNLVVSADVAPLGIPLASAEVLAIRDASLASILDGSATISLLTANVLGQTVQLLPDLTNEQKTGLLSSLFETVSSQLKALFEADGALNDALGALNGLLANLFTVLEDVLVLTINAQNEESGPVPDRFQDLPQGQYDVAALYVGLLNMVDLLDVFLARGSVGPNVQRA